MPTRTIFGQPGSVVSVGGATFSTLNLTAATNQIGLDSDGTFVGTISMAALTAARTWTFPDGTAVIVLDTLAQTLTNKTLGAGTLVALALLADADATRDLGSAATRYRDLFLSRALAVGTTAQTGTANRFRMLQSMVRVTKSAVQSITINTDTAVTFDIETFDTDGLHDNVTDNTRLTAAIAGKYLVTGFVEYPAGASIIMLSAWIRKDGTTIYARTGTNNTTNTSWWSVTALVDLAAAGYVELLTRTGETLSIQSGTSSTAFSMVFVGE